VLLTPAVLLATAVLPMASGVVAIGLFGATWVAGVIGGVGAGLDGADARHPLQDPSAILQLGGPDAEAFPFLSIAPLSTGYLVWATVWVAAVWGLAAMSFGRRDLERTGVG
jgi:hypothetical protein